MAENHNKEYYITDITVTQQQPRNLKSAEKLIIIERQNHEIINIEELINDQLRKVI